MFFTVKLLGVFFFLFFFSRLYHITLNIQKKKENLNTYICYHNFFQLFVFGVDGESFGGINTPNPNNKFRRVK